MGKLINDIVKPIVNLNPQPPVNANPQPPVNADPQPPVNVDPQPPVNADPQPPVNADPQPPVNADPQPPVNVDPQPQKTSALPLIKVTSITVNGEEYVAGKDYDYESESPKFKITGTVESSETVKKIIVGHDYFGNKDLEAIVDENGNWSFEYDFINTIPFTGFHYVGLNRLIATTEESGITSGIKLEGISDYNNGESYFAYMVTHDSNNSKAGNLDDYLSGKSSYVVQTHYEPQFENVIFSKDNINTNDFSYQLVHQSSWFNHIEEIGTGQTYDTYIPEYHQGYIENETWLNPNVVLQGNDNINATISYSVNALGTPEYYQSILTGYADDRNSWASSSITKADIDNEVSMVFNNKVYSENGIEIYTSSDDISNYYLETPLSGRGDEVFAIGNSGDNVITVTVPGELYGYAQGGVIGTAFLDGKDGQDTLVGNIGVDVFSFSSALDGTVDTIKNFDVANDKIGLNATVFNQILKDNSVDSDPPFVLNEDTGEFEFRDGAPYSTIGLELENSDVFGSYILHNQETGAVSYDYTGQGNYDAAIQFAQVDAGLVLTASNFTILDLPAVNYPL